MHFAMWHGVHLLRIQLKIQRFEQHEIMQASPELGSIVTLPKDATERYFCRKLRTLEGQIHIIIMMEST